MKRQSNTYEELDVGLLKPYERNARTHSDEQVEKIIRSIKEFGFINPILIDKENMIIAGHGRVMAAKKMGLAKVPTLRVENLTPEQIRAYVIADNRLAEDAGWDMEILKLELEELEELDFDITLTGFDMDDIYPKENETKDRKDLSDEVKSEYQIIIEFESEEDQELAFEHLSEEGYECRLLTL